MSRNMLRKFWNDEGGFIVSADLILISTILVIGVLVGLVTLRDQVVQELGDLATAVGNLNQSYSFSGATITFDGSTFTVAGSNFLDASDFCETGTGEANTGTCINVSVGATPGEG